MIDIAKIAAEGVASALGRPGLYFPPNAAPGAEGAAVLLVTSEADSVTEGGPARFGKKSPRFRVYQAPAMKIGGAIVHDGRLFRLTSDPEAADRGRYSWFVSVRDEGPAP